MTALGRFVRRSRLAAPGKDLSVALGGVGGRPPRFPLTTFLVDRPAGEATILLPMLRAYSAVKIGKYDVERTVLRGAHFTRAGYL